MRARRSRRLRLPRLHQLQKAIEQVAAVVWPRGRLGVVLHAEYGTRFVLESLDRVVVEVPVRDAQIGRARDVATFGPDREAVVLRRDLDAAPIQLFHGVVTAVVAEGKLVGLTA